MYVDPCILVIVEIYILLHIEISLFTIIDRKSHEMKIAYPVKRGVTLTIITNNVTDRSNTSIFTKTVS